MGLKLHLGVIDLPYVAAPSPRQKKATASTVTTGQVAEWLEEDYKIMETFAARHIDGIAADLANSVAGAAETLMMGGSPAANPFASAESAITHRMKNFITTGEMDRLGLPGVPTQAAKDRASGARKSARMKRARKGSNQQPVSFYDSGLFQSSMTAWIE